MKHPLFVEGSTGGVESKVGECELFEYTICFDEAKLYRKSSGRYLRHNQWGDITVSVWIVI